MCVLLCHAWKDERTLKTQHVAPGTWYYEAAWGGFRKWGAAPFGGPLKRVIVFGGMFGVPPFLEMAM